MAIPTTRQPGAITYLEPVHSAPSPIQPAGEHIGDEQFAAILGRVMRLRSGIQMSDQGAGAFYPQDVPALAGEVLLLRRERDASIEALRTLDLPGLDGTDLLMLAGQVAALIAAAASGAWQAEEVQRARERAEQAERQRADHETRVAQTVHQTREALAVATRALAALESEG